MLELIAAMAALAGAETLKSWPAPEANQGVAADATHFYAVDNSVIAKYERASGRKVAAWTGDAATFPHLNSCDLIRRELVCAASNYPATPMDSRVEVFDPKTLKHLRSVPLGHQGGSLTWVAWKDGGWWAGFATYDGRGGEPGRDHKATKVVRFDAAWRPQATWTYPAGVLERFAPRSASGGVFGADGRLYVSGHDLPEVYVMEAPAGGGVLRHVATLQAPIEGQAIAFDPAGVLFGIRRADKAVVAVRLPKAPR
jgi:outer membrane protein assembly factor BamB